MSQYINYNNNGKLQNNFKDVAKFFFFFFLRDNRAWDQIRPGPCHVTEKLYRGAVGSQVSDINQLAHIQCEYGIG